MTMLSTDAPSGKVTAAGEPEPARRTFFRSLVQPDPKHPRHTPWQRVDGLSATSGDVFWCGLAASDAVYVAGDEGAIFRFDGAEWTRMNAPAPVPIHAMWQSPDGALHTAGWMGAIMRHDGETWHLDRGCVVGEDGRYATDPQNTPLFALAGDAEGRLWAVGDDGTILGRDLTGAWHAEVSGTRAHLRAIAICPDGTLFAAGGGGTVLRSAGDGQWSVLDCPVPSSFQAVLAVSPDHLLLAGGRYRTTQNGFRGDLVTWRDGRFFEIETGHPLARLRALAPYRDGILAVGDRGHVYFAKDGRIDRLESATHHDLMAIVPLAAGEALAVGDFGTVMTAAGDLRSALAAPALADGARQADWEAMASPVARQLWGLCTSPNGDAAHACGNDGTVLRFADGQWESLPDAGSLALHAVCDTGDGGLFAAGQLGEIHHFDGRSWRKHFDLHVDVTILSLWAAGPASIFAVGDEGLIMHWDGAEWQRMSSGTKSAIYGVWGMDSEHVLAVGDFGLILRWNGSRWDEFHAGTENFLFDVWGRGLDDVFVVGLSGTIGHFNGQRWTLTPVRARGDILAVSGGEDGTYAVGSNGLALHHDGNAWHIDETGFDGGLRDIAHCGAHVLACGDGGTILKRVGRRS